MTASLVMMDFCAKLATLTQTFECLVQAVADVCQHQATMNLSQLKLSHVLKVAQGAYLPYIALSASVASTSLAMDTATKAVP